MSSTISLVIGAVGLLAAVIALIVVLRRPPGREQPAVPPSPRPGAARAETAGTGAAGTGTVGVEAAGGEAASAEAGRAEAASAEARAAAQRALEQAGHEAEQVRIRAEKDAATI